MAYSDLVAFKGAEDLLRLSKALKNAGKTELRKDLHRGIQQAAKPLIPKVREAARRDLPKHGGLNERIARKPYRVQVRTGAHTSGVRIVGTKVDPRINQGRVGHPVFGRKGKAANGGRNFVVQRVPRAEGYFDETLSKQRTQIRDDVIVALDQFVDRLVREAR